jgi:type III secretory pathway component EscR
MTKFAIRLLALAIYATPLVMLPVVTQANAATSESKPVKKHVKKVQRAPAAQDPYKSPFASKYDEDRERINSAGGGGY